MKTLKTRRTLTAAVKYSNCYFILNLTGKLRFGSRSTGPLTNKAQFINLTRGGGFKHTIIAAWISTRTTALKQHNSHFYTALT